MAVHGTLEDCAAQVGPHPGFSTAFAFLRAVLGGRHEASAALAALPEGATGVVELDGRSVYAVLQHLPTVAQGVRQMEAHRRYADVQLVVRGQEVLEIAPSRGLAVTTPYDTAQDVELYAPPAERSRLLMEDGTCAVLFPSDAHAPMRARGRAPAFSRRIVVKVCDPAGKQSRG